jgi:hypothetical protein
MRGEINAALIVDGHIFGTMMGSDFQKLDALEQFVPGKWAGVSWIRWSLPCHRLYRHRPRNEIKNDQKRYD